MRNVLIRSEVNLIPVTNIQEFNMLLFHQIGLSTSMDGEMFFEDENGEFVKFIVRDKNVRLSIDPTNAADSIFYDPYDNRLIMKTMFHAFIDLNDFGVYSYSREFIPNGKSYIRIIFRDRDDFESNAYYHDALKFAECIEYLNTGRVMHDFSALDYTQEDMENMRKKRHNKPRRDRRKR